MFPLHVVRQPALQALCVRSHVHWSFSLTVHWCEVGRSSSQSPAQNSPGSQLELGLGGQAGWLSHLTPSVEWFVRLCVKGLAGPQCSWVETWESGWIMRALTLSRC